MQREKENKKRKRTLYNWTMIRKLKDAMPPRSSKLCTSIIILGDYLYTSHHICFFYFIRHFEMLASICVIF